MLNNPDQSFIDEVQHFWKENYARSIDTTLHTAFKNLTGKKETKLIPTKLLWKDFVPYFNGNPKKNVYRDKNLYDTLINTERAAKTVIKRVRGFYYTDKNDLLTEEQVWEYIKKNNSDLIVKPSTTNNGQGIFKLEINEGKVLKDGQPTSIEELQTYYGPNYMFQEIIKQHPIMSKPHPDSVNTLRMVTLRWQGEIQHLLTFARFGANGSVRDNAGTGGVCVGITDKGEFLDIAIDEKANSHKTHPTTGYKFGKDKIPNYDEFISFVKDLHKSILHYDFISWDVAVGEDGKPIFLELNFRGVSWLYQLAAQKPLFGDLTSEVLKFIKSEISESKSTRDYRPDHFNSRKRKSNSSQKIPAEIAPTLKAGLPEKNNTREIILSGADPATTLDLSTLEKVDDQIDQLGNLHEELDNNFIAYYENLIVSPNMKIRTSENSDLYAKLSQVVKRDYLSYAALQQFERRKLNVRKAISYRDILVEKSEIKRLGYPEYAWKLHHKRDGYKFADSINLKRPQTDPKTYKFSEIEPQKGPVVVKPTSSFGSMGVYLVYDENTIFSARRGKWLSSWRDLVIDLEHEQSRDKKRSRPYLRKDEWMIEELILGVDKQTIPPSDLKFYCFYGEVVIISETNPINKKKFCYWDTEMNMIQTGRYDDQVYKGDGFTKEDLDIAIKASLEIPTPFIRLDMLKGQEGLFFGEATPRSGHFQLFNDEYDRKMGEAFRKAEARIVKDMLNGKSFGRFKQNFEI